MKTVVSKLKMSDDHSRSVFILDIGNTERLTAGVKDMTSNKVLPIRLKNVSQVEFGSNNNILFYTETDHSNRPCKVKMLNLETNFETSIYRDDDPTHYIDLGVTKDKKFLIIASNTKEDSEIWILPRSADPSKQVLTPIKLISRIKDVKAHIDHLRDFFITITTLDSVNKQYKIAKLDDSKIDFSGN
jgi:protease II